MSCMDSIRSCLLYIISCFGTHLDDPYHVREMMQDSPRKYSDHELDTDSIVLDIDNEFSHIETRELNHRGSRYKESDEDIQYQYSYYIPKTNIKRVGDSVGESGVDGKGSGWGTDSDMSEIVPVIGGESEETTILHTFWRNIRGVMRDSIDEADGKENNVVLDNDTVVL